MNNFQNLKLKQKLHRENGYGYVGGSHWKLHAHASGK
jgi:hypothetical protein